MLNKRFTVIANPRFHAKQWNANYEADFKYVLDYFTTADPEGLAKLEAGKVDVPATPATPATLAILAWRRVTSIQRIPARKSPIRTPPH